MEDKGYMQTKTFTGAESEVNDFLKTVNTINVTHLVVTNELVTIVSYYVTPVEEKK